MEFSFSVKILNAHCMRNLPAQYVGTCAGTEACVTVAQLSAVWPNYLRGGPAYLQACHVLLCFLFKSELGHI